MLSGLELVKTIVQILDDKKANQIEVIGVSDLTTLGDYFIIADADNATHVKSLVDEVEYQTKQLGQRPQRVEKDSAAQWIILDYQDVVVHVFHKQAREFYKLEHLWADGQKLPLEQFIKE